MAPEPDSEPEEDVLDDSFTHLLKPLQDINKNWDIDISYVLDNYIRNIRRICDDDIIAMNFYKAAIVLSNSASIYCKKIEYLFAVVEQLLDALSIKHNLTPIGAKEQRDHLRRHSRNAEPVEGSEKRAVSTRRRRAALLDTESFEPLDDICSDRCITLDISKYKCDKKRKPVVLNAAIKVPPPEHSTCYVYDFKSNPMGKKHEFRLSWRISSDGTLHEDFVVKKNKFQAMKPLECTVVLENDAVHDSGAEMDPSPCDDFPLATSLQHDYCENVDRLGEVRISELGEEDSDLEEVDRKDAVNTVDVKEVPWQPVDPNLNMPEKPIKKRKVVKIPPGLDDKKRKSDLYTQFSTFTITDCLFEEFNNVSFYRDLNFSFQSKQAAKQKFHLLKHHRAKYIAYLEKEAAKDQIDDFFGFDADDGDDNDPDFEGFDGDEAHDVDAPLPNCDDIVDPHADDPNWQEDDGYKQTAARTMAAFKARRIDHGTMTDMARRVEEWHQKITPKLEAAESRSSFDIHGYGTKVLDKFCGKIGSEKLFQDIVSGEPKEEVARYFLSTLLLANQYNVEITKTDTSALGSDCMKLKLLSLVRHHEELDDNMRQTSSDI